MGPSHKETVEKRFFVIMTQSEWRGPPPHRYKRSVAGHSDDPVDDVFCIHNRKRKNR